MTADNVTQLRKPADRGPELGPVVAELRLKYLTDAEYASLERQSPGLLADIRENEALKYGIEPANPEPNPIAYDNGVPADGLSGVGL